jgi:6-phosphogluconolactonase (cycloisomerase 2 family)
MMPSDSLEVWAIDNNTGILTFKGLAAAAGQVPRQFSLNKAGTLVAVALQGTGVAIIERDPGNGSYVEIVAVLELPDKVNCVIWDER